MATKNNAKKQSQNAKVNLDFEEVKVSKKTKNKAKKTLKKVSLQAWLFALLFLLIGIGGGIGAWMFVCKNDCFEIVGKDELTLTLNEKYTDEGVKVFSFGKDISKDVVTETDLKVDENGNYYAEDIGTYYIKYSSKDFKYGTIFKVEKIRLVTFVEPSEEIDVDKDVNGGNE
ncbi:MAG: hypothetical protein J6Q51_00240 [Clostridia bacterium]|nr:hypothetical protein [Clostridia bacterium]